MWHSTSGLCTVTSTLVAKGSAVHILWARLFWEDLNPLLRTWPWPSWRHSIVPYNTPDHFRYNNIPSSVRGSVVLKKMYNPLTKFDCRQDDKIQLLTPAQHSSKVSVGLPMWQGNFLKVMHAILLCYRMPLSTYNYGVTLNVFSQRTLQEPLPQQHPSQLYFAGQNKWSKLLPGLGSILAKKSRWGRSRQRLLGSPSRCSTSTSSLIPWVNDCGLWCYSGVKQNKPSSVINHCGCQDSRLAKKKKMLTGW